MKKTVMVGIIFLFLLASCDNPDNPVNPDSHDNPDTKSPADRKIYIDYSAGGSGVSDFIGWRWVKDTEDDTEFTWIFKNDGTVSVTHCCEIEIENQFSYLIRGNVFVALGSEMGVDEIKAVVFTMTETDVGVSLTMNNGECFTRGERDDGVSSAPPLQLTNTLLGTWQEADGKVYTFTDDAGLEVTSNSEDPEQYGYLVRQKTLLILGPLVDGTKVVLQQYQFSKSGDKLTLSSSNDTNITLTR